jgi:hypothetical protein
LYSTLSLLSSAFDKIYGSSIPIGDPRDAEDALGRQSGRGSAGLGFHPWKSLGTRGLATTHGLAHAEMTG